MITIMVITKINYSNMINTSYLMSKLRFISSDLLRSRRFEYTCVGLFQFVTLTCKYL